MNDNSQTLSKVTVPLNGTETLPSGSAVTPFRKKNISAIVGGVIGGTVILCVVVIASIPIYRQYVWQRLGGHLAVDAFIEPNPMLQYRTVAHELIVGETHEHFAPHAPVVNTTLPMVRKARAELASNGNSYVLFNSSVHHLTSAPHTGLSRASEHQAHVTIGEQPSSQISTRDAQIHSNSALLEVSTLVTATPMSEESVEQVQRRAPLLIQAIDYEVIRLEMGNLRRELDRIREERVADIVDEAPPSYSPALESEN